MATSRLGKDPWVTRLRFLALAAVLIGVAACSTHKSIQQSIGPGATPTAQSTPTATPTHSGSPKSGSTGTPSPSSADATSVTRQLLGLPPVPAGSTLPGYLLIADRD